MTRNNPTTEKSIHINDQLSLVPITQEDQKILMELMMDIYRPVYQHLWYDDGSGYVESQCNPENLSRELSDLSARFYFVQYCDTYIGVFRFLLAASTPLISYLNTIKLHRIYLSPATHGQGIGKKLIQWLAGYALEQEQKSIWLESMDTQGSAINFYKHLGFQTFDTFVLDSPKMRPERRGMLRMKLEI